MSAGFQVRGFVALQRPVVDLGRSVDFYVGGLGFEVAGREPDRARLVLGPQTLELVRCGDRVAPDPAAVGNARFQHIAIVASDLAAAVRRLDSHAPQPLTRGGPVRLPDAAGGVTAWKFRDPDGHPLELIAFPPRGGAAAWRDAAGRGPTLGYDHSALGVADAERSLAFYVGVLGLRLASRHRNRGAEQAALDGVETATVDVIALEPHAEATPHLELLAYLEPAATRASAAADDRPADVICLSVEGLDALRHRLPTRPDATGPALRVRDPDGHVLLLTPA